MASNRPGHIKQLAETLSDRCRTLINADLKKICKEEGETQGGNKAQLQSKVIGIINRYVAVGDYDSLDRLRHRISNHGEAPPPQTQSNVNNTASSTTTPYVNTHTTASTATPAWDPRPGYGYGQSQTEPTMGNSTHIVSTPYQSRFKDSPFYDILDVVARQMTLEATPSHRSTATMDVVLGVDVADRLRQDSGLRLMLFSFIEEPLARYQKNDVAFPAQIEVKINQEDVKANYKGLKNKPGSTRPVDITDFIRKVPGYKNKVAITYALTHKRFYAFVYLVQKHSVEDLAARIKSRNIITKQTVIDEMRKKADDPDIVLGSTVMSLKDPVSTLRISIPCRSNLCSHNQCFDAVSFLQLQEQAPTWQCPICHKSVSYQGLALDQYVQEILDNVPKSTDQVTIEPDGNWINGNKTEAQSSRNGHQDNGSDDDLVEITDYRVNNIKSEALNTPLSMARTPPLSSRDSSTAPRTGTKRKSEVIDLTLSDDDEPQRPAKKVMLQTPASMPDPPMRARMANFGNSPTSFVSPSFSHSVPYPLPQQSLQQPHNDLSSGIRLDLRPSRPRQPSTYPYRPPTLPPPDPYAGQGAYSNYDNSP